MNVSPLDRSTPWTRPLRSEPHARARLLCFPYAGSGPSVFRAFANLIVANVEVLAVEYPGRESKRAERPLTDVHELVKHLLPAILAVTDKPLIFFGHSMGALVAYEVTRALSERHGVRPELLIVSAAAAPHCSESRPIHALPNREFLRSLLRLNGIPPEVLGEIELITQALPVLRADFTLCETYRYAAGTPLICPVMALGGRADPRVQRERVEAWREHAGVAFTLSMFAGDHFFIKSNCGEVVNVINRELLELMRL